MPEQKPEVRARNFQEVTLGYSKAMAMEEASRCLNCKNKPCVSGCPVGVRIPEFIACVAAGDFDKAYDIITSTNGLPAVCGRVCPQEHQCEGKCVRGIKGEPVGIGRLERFVADYKMEQGNTKVEVPASNGHKVAVVGAGPSGLTCAGDLARLEPESVRLYLRSVAQAAWDRGMCPMLWDNGEHYDRSTCKFRDEELLRGLQTVMQSQRA